MNEVHVESKPLRSSWLWLVSGVALIALTHFRWGVGALAWVAPVPLLVYLRSTSGFRSRALFSVAVIVGWTLATLKIISAPMPAALAMAFGVPIALFQLVPYFSWDFLRRRCRPWVAALAFASVGVLVEWAEWRLTPLGSWGAAAYTQVEDLPLLQVASLFGMAGVSFLVYWCAAAVEAAIAERGTAPSLRGLAVAIGVVAAAHAFGAIRLGEGVAGDTVRVAAVGTDSTAGGLPLPDADTRHRWDDALFARTVQAAKAGARVVVWTEAATVALVEDEAQLVGRGRDVARAEGIELVLAYVVPVQVAPLRYENKYQWLRPDGTIDHVYLKHEPVPGEPSVRGTGAQGLVATAAGNASGAICYDFDFPYLALAQARLGVDFVAVPSSDWAGIDPIHAQMAAVRAIEGGFSLVRSTRFGLSVVVDPLGRTRGWLSNNDSRERVLVASVPVHRVATLYTRIGDLLPATCGAFIASLLVSLGLRRRGRTQGGVAPSHAVARELA